MYIMSFFFFSSRRRHTRSTRDWSSDVCSSDLACVVAGLAGIATGLPGCRQPPVAPASGALRGANVLLITIDTLRADHVGAYGNRLGLTPTLDRLAREGLRFERAYAHVPLTLPSHSTIMTGLYPIANGVHDNGTFHLGEMATLATSLRGAGYRTGAFVGSFV